MENTKTKQLKKFSLLYILTLCTLYPKMKYTLAFLFFLFVNRCASMNPFHRAMGLKRVTSSKLLLQMKDDDCFLKKRIKAAIEKKLEKLPKIIIVPPQKQNEEETWNSGEVNWDPKPDSLYVRDKDISKEPPLNGTIGYGVFPPPRPLSPVDFAMAAIF